MKKFIKKTLGWFFFTLPITSIIFLVAIDEGIMYAITILGTLLVICAFFLFCIKLGSKLLDL